jgi:hypothetical protein
MVVNRPVLFLLLLFAGFSVLSLFYQGYPWNPDHQHKLLSLTAQSDLVLSSGQFPVRWFPDFCRGSGSPYPLFESPAVNIVTWMMSCFTQDPLIRLRWLTGLLVFTGCIGMYRLGNLLGGAWGGFAAGMLFTYAPFRIAQIQLYSDLPGYAAGAVFPWAIYTILTCNSKRLSLIPAVLTVGLMTFVDLTGLFGLAIAIPLILLLPMKNPGKHRFQCVMISVVCGCCLSASFWIPAVLERNHIHQGHWETIDNKPDEHLMYPQQWFAHQWGNGVSRAGPNDTAPFQLGMVHIFCLVAMIFYLFLITDRSHAAMITILILLGCVLFLTSVFSGWIWREVHFLWLLNYPWRLLWLAAGLISIGAGLLFRFISESEWSQFSAVAAITTALILLYCEVGFTLHPGHGSVDPSAYTPSAIRHSSKDQIWIQNYLPAGQIYPDREIPYRFFVQKGDLEITRWITDTPHCIRFESTASHTSIAIARMFKFPGWTLDIDGQPITIDMNSSKPIIEFSVPPGHHLVTLSFNRTWLQKLADFLSIFGLLWLMTYLIFTTFFKKPRIPAHEE